MNFLIQKVIHLVIYLVIPIFKYCEKIYFFGNKMNYVCEQEITEKFKKFNTFIDIFLLTIGVLFYLSHTDFVTYFNWTY